MKTYSFQILTAALVLALGPGALAHGGGGGHSGGGGGGGGGGSWHGGGGGAGGRGGGFGWRGEGGGHAGGFGWHGGGWHGHYGRYYGSYFGGVFGYPLYGEDFGYGYGDDYADPYYAAPYYSGVQPHSYAGRRTASLVMEVQDSLAKAGYYRGTIDGTIGPQTRTAIGRYQSSHDLPVSRRIDESLLQSLRLL